MNAILFLSLAFGVQAPALKNKPAPEQATIVGEWSVVDSVMGGKPDGLQNQNPIEKIVITETNWGVYRNGAGGPGATIRIDSKAAPAELDIGVVAGGKSNCAAIYKIEKDILTVCYTLNGDRPTNFDSPIGSQIRILTLKRIPAENKP